MKKVLSITLLAVILILAWTPWISREYAQEKAIKTFEDELKNSLCDLGCPVITGIRIGTTNKPPFGYIVEVKYEKERFNIGTSSIKYFVSFLGKVHNYQAWWNQLLTNMKGSQIQVIQKHYPIAKGYPKYGHADDYSWVAGRIRLDNIEGGCTSVIFSEKEKNEQNYFGVLTIASERIATGLKQGDFVVLKGKLGESKFSMACPSQLYETAEILLQD